MENFLISEDTNSLHPKSLSFSGHQTFPFRYTWLKKGVDAVADAVAKDQTIFSSENASVVLGVGKNMVSSIRHWCITAGLIRKNKNTSNHHSEFEVTDEGKTIFFTDTGKDQYLENPATLWWIHWRIATNMERASTWAWAFNFLNYPEFTRNSLTEDLIDWIKQQENIKKQPSENTIKKDVNCFFRTYCLSHSSKTAIIEDTFDCPLVELDLIREVQVEQGENRYQFNLGPKPSLTDSMLALTITEFWNRHFPDTNTLSFSKIMYSKLSPGQVFKLDENTLVMYLEKLEAVTEGTMTYDDTAGLKQISLHEKHEKLDVLELLKGVYEKSTI